MKDDEPVLRENKNTGTNIMAVNEPVCIRQLTLSAGQTSAFSRHNVGTD